MAPKIPNLKFKPKTDTRVKEEENDDDPELMSLVQRERLKQLQQQQQLAQQHEKKANTQIRPEMQSSLAQAPATSSTQQQAAKSTSASAKATAESNARSAAMLRNSSAKIRAMGDAMASLPSYGDGQAVTTLPRNSMEAILTSRAGAPGTDNEEAEGMMATSFIRPVGLAVLGPDEVRQQSSLAASLASATIDSGTAFLEEWKRERARSNAGGREFFRLDDNSFGASPSNELVWMQLPRPAEGQCPAISIHSLPPGKIGQMKVYKSGRCELEINGVVFDVSCDTSAATWGGISQVAAAVLPPSAGGENPSCYELGEVTKKFVCTPNFLQ